MVEFFVEHDELPFCTTFSTSRTKLNNKTGIRGSK